MTDSIPTTVSYDDAWAREDAAEETLKDEAKIAIRLKMCKKGTRKPKPQLDKKTNEYVQREGLDLAVNTTWEVLDPEDGQTALEEIRHGIGLPIKNLDSSPNHTLHWWYKDGRGPWAELMRAYNPDVFKSLGKEGFQRELGVSATEAYNTNFQDYMGMTCYATVKHSDCGQYVNIQWLQAELREGSELTPREELFEKKYYSEGEGAEKSKKKKKKAA